MSNDQAIPTEEAAATEPKAVLCTLDPGIKQAVEILQAEGIETFESCEGGTGHAFPEPTIRFHGHPAAGWRALALCLTYGLPVLCLRRTWYVCDRNEPNGPHWEITFRERIS